MRPGFSLSVEGRGGARPRRSLREARKSVHPPLCCAASRAR